jgi:hypothetical protein
VSLTDLLIIAGVVLAITVFGLSVRMVGDIADQYGEDRASWQMWMLPFGIFGPLIARIILDRRNGGGGGYA